MRFRSSSLLSIVVLTLAVAGCSGSEPLGRFEMPVADRVCDKDLAQVWRYIAQTPLPGENLRCNSNDPAVEQCPCGTYCAGEFCTANCVTADDPDRGCEPDEICSNLGQCYVPGAPLPTEILSLAASPGYAEVVTPTGSNNFADTVVQLVMTGDSTPPDPPRIFVRGATTTKATCPGGAADCQNPTQTLVNELEVACGTGAAFVTQCSVDDWAFESTSDGVRAVREVRVRPRKSATATVWELDITASDHTAPQSVSLVRASATPRPLEGMYTGRLVLSRGGAPEVVADLPEPDPNAPPSSAGANLSLPITAVIKHNQVVLIDPARILSESGKLRLKAPGTYGPVNWLGADDGILRGRARAVSREHDAARGHVRQRFTVALPTEEVNMLRLPATLFGLADLDWRGPIDAPACAAGCATGTSCDSSIQLCLPGPAMGSGNEVVGSTLGFASLWEWTGAVEPQLTALGIKLSGYVTPDSYERLQCYRASGWDPETSPQTALLTGSLLARTGDLRCGTSGASLPAGVPLRNRIDASGGLSATESVSAMMGFCRDELAAAVPSGTVVFPEGKCLSPARVLPVIGMAVSRGARDTRGVLLLQHLVRGWVGAAGFTAQQGIEQVTLGDADSSVDDVDSIGLLAASQRLWQLVTDSSVAHALVTLPPADLANPDYRGSNRPAMYWPGTGKADVEGSFALSTQRDCVQRDRCAMDAVSVDPRQLDLSGDLSAAFEVESVRTTAYQNRLLDSAWLDEHPLIESPWLTVVETVDNEIRDIHFTRTGRTSAPHGQRLRAPSWQGCRSYCIVPDGHITVPTCRSWSFQPLGPGDGWCNLSSDLDGRVAQANTRSGVLTRGPRAAGPIAVPDFTRDTRRVGNPLSVTQHVPDASACYDLCYDNLACTAISYFWDASTCHQHTGTSVLETFVNASTASVPRQALRIGHTTTRNRPVSLSFPVRGNAAKDHILVSRIRNRYTRRDKVGGSTADTPSSAVVKRGGPARLWIGRRGDRTAAHAAIWDTALDAHEYQALRGRAAANQVNYVARPPIALPEPTGVKNRDQGTELAVTLVEALVPQLRLLQSYLESIQGRLYESCVSGASSPLAEEARDRASVVLRTALYVQGLAQRMHDRARQLACTADAQCPTGATCGIDRYVAVDGLTATTTGSMQQCTGLDGGGDVVGICVPATGNQDSNGGLGGSGSATPGQVGTATFTFTNLRNGSHALWARTAARPHAASFWFRVDAGGWRLWYPDGATSHDWAWSRFGDADGNATLIPLSAGTHSITVSVHDDGLVLRELALSSDSVHPPDDTDDVCYRDGAPIVEPAATPERVARDEVWQTAQSELDGAMQALLVKSAAMGECRNPLGIEETDLPLYFSPYTDESTPAVALYFAASLNLYDKASKAIGAALTAYQAVDVEWRDLQNAKFQSETLGAANDARMSAIAGRYSDELEELCGSSSSHDGGLLGEFIDGDRQADTCFVEITKPGCLANLEQPISEASATCYRGTVGQALLGMKTANYAISTASMSWESKQDQYEAQAAACAHLQETASIIKAHQDHMAALRRKKGLFDKISAGIGIAAGVATGTGAAALAASLFGNVGEQIGGENGPIVGWSDGLGPTGQVLGIASGAVNLSSMFSSASEIGAEQAAFQVQMQARANELEIMQCFAVADRLRDEIEISAVTIKQAVTDFEQATMAFGHRRARIGQLVAEGRAEVAREDERSLALPYHEFRLDRRIQVYQRKLAHAKRMTYLFLRAAEYDKQASFPYRAVVLDARNIEQLEAAFDDIANELNDGRIGPNGATPQARSRVVSLLELMGLPDSDVEALYRHLQSPASFVYGTDGQLLGRGVRFQLTPTSPVFVGSSVPDSCAEHVTGVTGSVQLTGGNNEEELAFKLAQRNVFASQQCNDGTGDPVLVTASHWPARNLFEERPTSLVDTTPTTPSTIDTLVNLTRTQLKTTPPRLVTDFMGRGLFGDYVLYFDKDLFSSGSDIDMSRVSNLLLRLDWTSGENGAAPE
jgi:hypothetical protein